MSTLHEDLATYLQELEVVEGYGIDCFGDFVPSTPDDILVIYEYPGDDWTPFTDVVHRSIQIISRSVSPDIARERALKAHKALQSDNMCLTLGNNRFAQVHLRQMPFKLGVDDNDRITYVFNVGVTTKSD